MGHFLTQIWKYLDNIDSTGPNSWSVEYTG